MGYHHQHHLGFKDGHDHDHYHHQHHVHHHLYPWDTHDHNPDRDHHHHDQDHHNQHHDHRHHINHHHHHHHDHLGEIVRSHPLPTLVALSPRHRQRYDRIRLLLNLFHPDTDAAKDGNHQEMVARTQLFSEESFAGVKCEDVIWIQPRIRPKSRVPETKRTL